MRVQTASISLLLSLAACSLHADDWPTYMHDNARSGVTPETLKLPLAEHWRYRSPAPPKPAWPPPQPGWTELPKVDFDDAFYTVADRDTVYFGSSVDHQIHALDAKTGAQRWSFFTQAPVRLAPTLAGDRVLAGSDDGKVYCLARGTGKQLWSVDGAPSPRKVIGNGSVMSLWPVRTGVLVDGERAYFGAGLFPYHKVDMHAVNVADGKSIWKVDTVTTFGGFSPQGYMFKAGKGLVIPSGRAAPVSIDPEDGKVKFEVPHAKDKGGPTGIYGTVVDDVFYVGTQNMLYGTNAETGEPAGRWPNSERLVATPERYILLKGPPAPGYGRKTIGGTANEITSVDRNLWQQFKKDADGLKKATSWRFAKPSLASLIVAGDHVIAGGDGEVFILNAADGKLLDTLKVDGLAVGLTVAHGRLLVSTTSGAIHAFGDPVDEPRSGQTKSIMSERIDKNDRDEALEKLLARLPFKQGFALVAGNEVVADSFIVRKGTDLSCMSVIKRSKQTEGRLDLLRMDEKYGQRLTAVETEADDIPYPDLAANLIVDADVPSAARTKEFLRILKPCGGVLLLPGKLPDDVTALLKLAGKLEPVEGFTKLTRGELPGSGWWTHQFADAGNSGSSGDKRIKGKLDVLWFGEPGADEFPDRHERGAAPLVSNGRVFCQGWNFQKKKSTLFCFDAYNGVRYWTRDIENGLRLNLPAASGNLACGSGSVFMAAGSKCHQVDEVTGKTIAVHETPADADGTRRDWGYLAVADGILVGSRMAEGKQRFSDAVFGISVRDGSRKFLYEGKEIRDTTIAYHDGRVFLAENRNPVPKAKLLKLNEETTFVRAIVAIEAADGKIAWQKDHDLKDCGSWDQGIWGSLQMLCKDDVVLLAGAYTIYNGSKATEDKPRRGLAISTKDGSEKWSSFISNRSRPVLMHNALLAEPIFHDLTTGEKILKKQGTKMVPWTMGPRTGGCGSLSASESMVFGRGGWTVWRDVDTGAGSALLGTRPGCFINIIPAGGVVVQAEASSGCMCYQAIQCTVVLRPALGE